MITDLALDDTSLGLLLPSLVPGHVGGLLQHVVTVLGSVSSGNDAYMLTEKCDRRGEEQTIKHDGMWMKTLTQPEMGTKATALGL